MKIIAINGSPRKNWNTATLLGKALEGAALNGAETELVHLYDLDYKGCTSCFSCKLKEGKNFGHCAMNDELTLILRKIEQTDAIILGSPCYWGNITGEMKSFLERLLFQNMVYDNNNTPVIKKKIATGFIHTFGAPQERMNTTGFNHYVTQYEFFLRRIFGHSETLLVYDTLQFNDYSKYEASMFSAEAKAKRREEIFPIDCQKAFDMGKNLIAATKNLSYA